MPSSVTPRNNIWTHLKGKRLSRTFECHNTRERFWLRDRMTIHTSQPLLSTAYLPSTTFMRCPSADFAAAQLVLPLPTRPSS